jgi:glycosyltransferase involved in cell wall biosynthesis
MMRPGETALTFRSGDVQDMAAKLRLLLSDSALALSLSAKARADYEARFAPIVVAKQTARFYERTLARCNR